MGTGYTAVVHGGNAVVTKKDKRDGSIVVRGKFLAGPEGASGMSYIGAQNVFAHMHFVIFADPIPCPTIRGCGRRR